MEPGHPIIPIPNKVDQMTLAAGGMKTGARGQSDGDPCRAVKGVPSGTVLARHFPVRPVVGTRPLQSG